MLDEHEKREKKLRAVVREMDRLNLTLRRRVSIKLDRPFQRGWKRFRVLTAEAENRDDREVLRAILRELDEVAYCRHIDFKHRPKRSKKLIEIKQGLRVIAIYEWQRKQHPDSWKKYFRYVRNSRWPWASYYEFLHPRLFELHIEKHWMTHYWDIDPLVIERHAELENHMQQRQLWPVYARLEGRSAGRRWRDDPRLKLLSEIATKEIRSIIEYGLTAETHSFLARTCFSRLTALLHCRVAIGLGSNPFSFARVAQ